MGVKDIYKKTIKNVFAELANRTKESPHIFGKTTYKVEMTFEEWYSMEQRYLLYFDRDVAGEATRRQARGILRDYVDKLEHIPKGDSALFIREYRDAEEYAVDEIIKFNNMNEV